MNLSPQNNIPVKNENTTNLSKLLLRILYAVLIICLFLVSIDMLMSAFRLFGKDIADAIFSVSAHPFAGIFIGLLITAILQSSSTVTAMVVAAVAAGALTIETATPMIMGANVGTTITSAVVALGHISKKKELRKAFAAASLHDFFNVLTALILFPLEYYTHFLSNLAKYVTELLPLSATSENFIPPVISIPSTFIVTQLNDFPILILIFALLCLFLAIRLFINLLKEQMIGKQRQKIHELFFGSIWKSFGWGFITTAAIQSSSVTTSLVVPLVATRKVNIQKAFPFIVGANIGTTLTTLLAALFKSEAAITIALVHILFNLIGAMIFLIVPFMKQIPILLAQRLGMAAMNNRSSALAYLLVVFFVLPFGMIYSSFQDNDLDLQKISTTDIKQDSSFVQKKK
ncbi:Na+/phosphate symporter [Bernardetia litoralis DSM 6794]|uniref:Na+/phosphate symporter n=1 Tax=Bernardetia litoralis (strain ATCC 23117 / DSM 6794 / NBRC 15988 / NCIMB 1366 / Fx l1 / Sio-4) TaxID=880071 RepID=I4AH85_BERLS|nr:Na/Pi symporter [Bernardetia litoralis]AFM03320.1 Na+/phosphate symporter [Bernardetia litoralis DSM 6794]